MISTYQILLELSN